VSRDKGRRDWQPRWEAASQPWDGTDYGERREAEKIASAAAKEDATHLARKAADNQSRVRQDKRQAKLEREQQKANEADAAAGVFAAVTRVAESGSRHCIRCDGSDFATEWRQGAAADVTARGAAGLLWGAAKGPAGLVAGPAAALRAGWKGIREAAVKVCRRCGAAYPVARPTKTLL
jgi:hypothetical protein